MCKGKGVGGGVLKNKSRYIFKYSPSTSNNINNQMSAGGPPRPLSADNLATLAELETLVTSKPLDNQRLLELLLKLSPEDSDNPKLSTHIERIFNLLLMAVLAPVPSEQGPEGAVGLPVAGISLLKEALKVVFRSQQNSAIKRTLIITFIENVLECLGVSDLTEVLSLISEQICAFSSSLQQLEQFKLLRIINHLLRRISKTEDYRIRGQLHFTLTRFLPLCHDSGFHYRAVPAKASEWERINLNEEDLKDGLSLGITYEFYEQFWEMQRFFMDLGELVSAENVANYSPGKNAAESLLTGRLKKLEGTLREVESYFRNHPAKETSEYYSQPLKFLKNFKLLELQLNDPFFRKIVMLQTLIFTFTLTNQTAKNAIPFTETDKKTIADIDAIARTFLLRCGEQGKELLNETQRLFTNEQYWTQLKDNWKDRKKTFFRKKEAVAEEESKHKVTDIEKKRQEIRRQINEKMKIEGSSLVRFLQNKDPLSIQKGPTCPSFSYFYTQALSCLQTFDKETGKQGQFQTRSQYNMFEWKAMRSLYRENIKDMWATGDKCPPKMKEYRLINLMYRKEDEPVPEPQKKIKEE